MQPDEPTLSTAPHGLPGGAILQPGRNCLAACHAGRVAFLLEGAAYFSAFRRAAEQARESILIGGWDMDSRLLLEREASGDGGLYGERLSTFLNRLAAEHEALHVNILTWDFHMIYALEREPLPVFNLGWRSHPRVHLLLDGELPLGGSHHRKVVVIDDRIAFVGGIDLTKRRWDTEEHLPHDPRRTDPGGEHYEPFHDVMMMVDGEAAARLGELLRTRWRLASGRTLTEPTADPHHDPWPRGIPPALRDVRVGIARTEPAFKGSPEVREVERLYLDTIAAARRWLYMENQYLSAAVVEDALKKRLAEPDGPEVVLVLPQKSSGWLEETTMDNLRGWVLARLVEADVHDRLRVFYPVVGEAGEEEVPVKVHAKVVVADDALARVGSSNLNNRSMGLDVECDLAVEAGEDPARREAVSGLMYRLLGTHLGASPERVAALHTAEGSLIRAIEALNGGEHRLRPLRDAPPPWVPDLRNEHNPVDPERPIEVDRMIDELVHEDTEVPGTRAYWVLRILLAAGLLALLGAFWYWAPVAGELDRATLARWAAQARANPMTPLYVLGGYVVGGVIAVPITLMIGATAAVFEPWYALAYAMVGTLASAATTYGLGRLLGREVVRRVAGGRLNRLSKQLARRGLLAVLFVRIVPVAPFIVVNMVAGASHIGFGAFILATFLGTLPGVLAVTLFVDQVRDVALNPSWANVASMLAVAAVVIAASVWVSKRFSRRDRSRAAEGAAPDGEAPETP